MRTRLPQNGPPLERIERFDPDAMRIFALAGELAARRVRAKTGESFARDVPIGVNDMREALRLLNPAEGYSGGGTPALSRRMEWLPKRGKITVEHLRKVLR